MSLNFFFTLFSYASGIGLLIYMIRHQEQVVSLFKGALTAIGPSGYIGGFASLP